MFMISIFKISLGNDIFSDSDNNNIYTAIYSNKICDHGGSLSLTFSTMSMYLQVAY
jgi:hypothetical protein